MWPFLGYSQAMAVASLLSSPLASIMLKTSHPSFIATAVAMPEKATFGNSRIDESVGKKIELKRKLFDLASPFDFENDQCARACSSQRKAKEAIGEGLLINACPKVSYSNIVYSILSITNQVFFLIRNLSCFVTIRRNCGRRKLISATKFRLEPTAAFRLLSYSLIDSIFMFITLQFNSAKDGTVPVIFAATKVLLH